MTAMDSRVPRSVALVGYRATGKSTIGRRLADVLGCPFVDADEALVAHYGLSIPEIFERYGEGTFRDWEQAILEQIAAQARLRPLVLATGGGVILRPANRQLLRALGQVVWLVSDAARITERLLSDARALTDRPALTAAGTLEEVGTLMAVREPYYREVADVIVASDRGSVEDVVAAIAATLDGPARHDGRSAEKNREPRC